MNATPPAFKCGSPLDLLLRLLLSNQSCCRRCCRQKNRSAGDWNLQRRRRRALALAIDSPSAAANAAVMRSSTILVRLRPPCRFIRPHTAWMSHLSSFFSRTNSVFSGGNFFRSPPVNTVWR